MSPSRTRSRINAAVYVLLTLPRANAVSRVTAVLAPTFARPLVPVHDDPSPKMIVTETPGIRRRFRSRSSSAWRLALTAIALAPAKDGWTFGDVAGREVGVGVRAGEGAGWLAGTEPDGGALVIEGRLGALGGAALGDAAL